MTRVAITTDGFEKAAPAYEEAGFDPMWLPCIKVEPAPEGVLIQARNSASQAEVIVLSSVRTVELLWPEGPMPSADVVAVGAETAAAIAARRGRVIETGQSGLEALAAKARHRLAAAKVVFPHASGADLAALHLIREIAGNLLEYEVYRTQPIAPEQTQVLAVAFASPSAVEGWHLARNLEGLVVGVIGATTGEALTRHRPPDVVAPEPTHRALAHALASHLEVKV